MQFTNPLLLFGLFAVLVPIIIHLFNFRRYKTFYFSNVKLLQDIIQKTKKESQLIHIIVLCLRILGIAALVFAFAQPYIPNKNNNNTNGNIVSIFVDNSFSMDASSNDGSLMYDAIESAKNIVNAFSFNDDFVLITQDFTAKESNILNKDEILELLDEIESSPNSHSMAEIISFEKNSCSNSRKNNQLHYYISDFQKNQFSFSELKHEKNSSSFLLPIPAKQVNNVTIDSCWFSAPVFKLGQEVALSIRIQNYSENDINKLPLKLQINGEQKAIAAVDIKANSFADYIMNYTITSEGTQCGTISIDDSPIIFDDKLFFVYEVSKSTTILAIQENNNNRYIKALYGKDSLFVYQELNINRINYSLFNETQLIVLDQIKTLSSGLIEELSKFVKNGGTLLVFPAEEMDNTSWGNFATNLSVPIYQKLTKQELKVGSINIESPYYKGAIESLDKQIEMPNIIQYYPISTPSATISSENIMQLENGSPMLSAYQVERGKVILSAVALNDNFGNAHKHALFFVPLHNIGIKSMMQQKNYFVVGQDEITTLSKRSNNSDEVFIIKSQRNSQEFIPEQRNIGNGVLLNFHSQVKESGFYDIEKGGIKEQTIAFNLSRKESNLSYYSGKELEQITQNDKENIMLLDADTKDLAKNIADKLNGIQLWRYFILVSLLCFLAEICILRFWGRAKVSR